MNFTNHGLIVPDISFYQDDDSTPQKVDFAKMKAAGAMGVIIRAGQNSWIDEDFRDFWKAAKEAGLPRGSYWFYDSRTEPAKQANQWHAAIGGDLPELGLWYDLEETYHGSYAGEAYWKQFALAVAAYFPMVKVHGVYTANWYWGVQVVKDVLFWGEYPLWVSQYNCKQTDVVLPKPWLGKEPWFWQFTASGDGATYGVESKEIDLSYFNGDLAKFSNCFGLNQEQEETEEPSMTRYEATSIYSMSCRPFHDVSNTPLTTVPAQAKMHGDTRWNETPGEDWLLVTDVNGTLLTQPGWVAITHASRVYCAIVDRQPTPEPVTPPDYLIAYWANGTTKKYIPE